MWVIRYSAVQVLFASCPIDRLRILLTYCSIFCIHIFPSNVLHFIFLYMISVFVTQQTFLESLGFAFNLCYIARVVISFMAWLEYQK